METIRIVIEDADGVLRVAATHSIRLLLLRYDDLLADPQQENIVVDLNPRRVEQLFQNHNSDEE